MEETFLSIPSRRAWTLAGFHTRRRAGFPRQAKRSLPPQRRARACPSPRNERAETSRGTGPRATVDAACAHHPCRAGSPDPAPFGLWRARTTAVGGIPPFGGLFPYPMPSGIRPSAKAGYIPKRSHETPSNQYTTLCRKKSNRQDLDKDYFVLDFRCPSRKTKSPLEQITQNLQ